MLDGCGKKYHAAKRINERGCYGQEILEAESRYVAKKNYCIVEDYNKKIIS